MKNVVCFFSLMLLLAGCKNEIVPQPANLISEEKMVDIIYDLTLLEAIKAQNDSVTRSYNINPKEYIYKKYNIDSLQFAKSNHYYASDVGNYKKIYEKVSKRMEDEQKLADAALKKANGGKAPAKSPDPDAPQVQ